MYEGMTLVCEDKNGETYKVEVYAKQLLDCNIIGMIKNLELVGDNDRGRGPEIYYSCESMSITLQNITIEDDVIYIIYNGDRIETPSSMNQVVTKMELGQYNISM